MPATTDGATATLADALDDERLRHADAAPAQRCAGERVIDSRALLGEGRQLRITHNGESYSLRLTRLGKLILTK